MLVVQQQLPRQEQAMKHAVQLLPPQQLVAPHFRFPLYHLLSSHQLLTLQAHRVMTEFVAAEFRNDPRVAPIVVLHLLENRVNRANVDTLQEKLSSQERTIAKLSKDLDAITSVVNKGEAPRRRRRRMLSSRTMGPTAIYLSLYTHLTLPTTDSV